MEKKNVKETEEKETKKIDKKDKDKAYVSFNLIEVVVITFMTAIVVSVCSGVIVYKNYEVIFRNNDSKVSGSLSEFIDTYDHITKSYVEKVDEKELIDHAIKGMFDYLEDSHTDYLDQEDSVSLQDKLKGEYKGIGVVIVGTSEGVYITDIFESSPAEKSGLKPGDKIISIDGEDLNDKSSTYISGLIKGKSSKFEITVLREKESITFSVSTSNVEIPSVSSKVIDNVGYIKIDSFSLNTYNQFKSKLEALEKENIKGLVIDVRSNSGGYLSSAYQIADLFIEKGKVIYQLKDKNGNIEAYNAKRNYKRTYKISVLINEGSASASEVLAGALEDSYGATLVGTKSFGKGTVQETENLTSGAMIKYTTAYWLTPKGFCVDKIGLMPTKEVIQNYETEADEQLDEAVNIIKAD